MCILTRTFAKERGWGCSGGCRCSSQQEGPLIGILQRALVIVIQPAIQRWSRGDREAAAVGVVLFFVGALITHLRAHDSSLAPATVFLLLPVTTLVLGLAT